MPAGIHVSEALKRLALLLAGTAVALGAAEGVARLLWTSPWWERLIVGQTQHQSHPYRLNAFRLRDEEIVGPKPPGQVRVLVLGDSFTFGTGVADREAVFPQILERELGASGRFPGGVQVLNGGLPGSLTGDWLRLWNRVAPRFEPDLLLIVFFLRDGTQTESIPEVFGRVRHIALRNRQSTLYRISHLHRLIRDELDRRAVGRLYTQHFLQAYFGDDAETAEWRRAQANLLRLRDLARERGARAALVVFPVLVELGPDYPFRGICDALEAFARANDLPVHSLLPAFLGREAAELWVSAVDQHPNEQGHAIAAESMLPFVTRLLEADAPVGPE